jgi:hypothetical protein
MKTMYYVLLTVQWVATLAGIVSSVPLAVLGHYTLSLLALNTGLVALATLKLELLSITRR